MPDLYLKFTDEYDLEKKILVDTQDFFLGRHSDNDLSVSNPKLSRTHAKIERYDDVYLLSDCDSSNGTKLNDLDVIEPTKLKHGDLIDLGGGIFLDVEFLEDKISEEIEPEQAVSEHSSETAAVASPTVTSASDDGSSLKLFAVLAVSFLFVLILALGGAAFFLSGDSDPETAKLDDTPISTYPDDTDPDDPVVDLTPNPTPIDDVSPNPAPSEPIGTPGNIPPIDAPTPISESPPSTPEAQNDSENIEIAALSFMRKIAKNDPNPVLTGPQLSVISSRAKRFQSSSALASNIKSVKRSSSEIASLASSKNMKPQFLATAALAQLGNRKGDVVATAKSMLDVLANVQREVGAGNETANDSLLTIAAYDVGQAGNERRFRDMISRLTQQSSNSPRQIRTIWFLKDKNKISNAQFEFAMRFLAIGTITQNPKAYSVNAEALTLN